MVSKRYIRKCKFHRVVDADTVELFVDVDYCGEWTMRAVRLRDLYMPERSTEDGQRMIAVLNQILTTATSPMTIETFRTSGGKDKKSFDRYVGVLMVGDTDIADLMRGKALEMHVTDEGIK